MEVAVVQPKKEWPKFLWGPDGRQARFDSPADVPRDYFPTVEEARAYAESHGPGRSQNVLASPVGPLHLTEPAAVAASAGEMEEFRQWQAMREKKRANMAKARAARKPKVEAGG
jgi:hypothetical protein